MDTADKEMLETVGLGIPCINIVMTCITEDCDENSAAVFCWVKQPVSLVAKHMINAVSCCPG